MNIDVDRAITDRMLAEAVRIVQRRIALLESELSAELPERDRRMLTAELARACDDLEVLTEGDVRQTSPKSALSAENMPNRIIGKGSVT